MRRLTTRPAGGALLPGNATSAGESIHRIIRCGLVEVEAEVIETEPGLVAPGDPAEVEAAGLGRVSGTVRQVSPVVGPVSRLGTIHVALDITDGEGGYVLRVEDGGLERRPVAAGFLWLDWREVATGRGAGARAAAGAAP